MPRPEQPIDGQGPCADFARGLRRERDRAGITYRQMAKMTTYSVTVLSCAANGKCLPSWEVTWAYLRACKVPASQQAHWKRSWNKARQAEEADNASS
ncbi:helix-turn-helix domain-containing protein [Microbispora rosea]|uniref:helix-turn-helix domain-containing protein n=1 Tax=Microbispora rosea TaxID=58117 RepID=UPI003681BC59